MKKQVAAEMEWLWTFEKVQLLNENFPGTFLGFETDSHSKYFCPREL